jgi:hypothetical protein
MFKIIEKTRKIVTLWTFENIPESPLESICFKGQKYYEKLSA